jgi:hypothetical protein
MVLFHVSIKRLLTFHKEAASRAFQLIGPFHGRVIRGGPVSIELAGRSEDFPAVGAGVLVRACFGSHKILRFR